MPTIFRLFGPLHLLILAAVPLVALLFVFIQRRLPGSSLPRWTMAIFLVVSDSLYYGYMVQHGQLTFPDKLPLELCDLSLFLTTIAMLTLNKLVFDLAFYWGLAGAGMSLLTLNLPDASPLFLNVQYFLDHGFIVAGILFLLWSRQARPRTGSILSAMIFVNIYAAFIGGFDYFFKTNYMFLCSKPLPVTLLTYLGPWPWYILACEGVALVLFALLYLPYRKAATAA